MAKERFEVKVSAVLVLALVFFCSPSNSASTGNEQTTGAAADAPPSAGNLFHMEPMVEKQNQSIVTIEFNCTSISTKNRTVVDSIYRNVHEEILKALRGMNSNTTVTLDTSSVATTPTSTTLTSFAIAITVTASSNGGPPVPNKKKRKRRQQTLDGDSIEANYLRFVLIDPETDENGILMMSLLLVVKGYDDHFLGSKLLEAAIQTNESGTLKRVAGVPVVAIYRGLPTNRMTMLSQNSQHIYLIWPLAILFVVVLFIVIGSVIYWRKQRQGKSWKVNEDNIERA